MTPMRGVFILGSDTEVGKTYQACQLLVALAQRGIRVGAYKPVASGVVAGVPSDPERLHAAGRLTHPPSLVCPQQFAAALAPPLAAELEGRRVDESLLLSGADAWRSLCDFLVVEGVGGALSPISDHQTCLDLAQQLRLPVLLVAANRLGAVNHVLLTLEAIAARRLITLAVVLNDLPIPDHRVLPDARLAASGNAKLISQFTDVPVVPHATDAMPRLLAQFE